MTPPKQLEFSSAPEGLGVRIKLAGPLTEEAKPTLDKLLKSAPATVILDFGAVTFLNSVGIRDWSHFLRGFKEKRQVVFDRLPDEVVRTINMVLNFRGKLPVKSVLRTYGCDHCGHEQERHLVEGKDYFPGVVPELPSCPCPQCGKEAEAFDSDQEFFQFLLTA